MLYGHQMASTLYFMLGAPVKKRKVTGSRKV
jgi:hypothetical protein